MEPLTIQFTQEQVRDLAGVTPGDIRQWRKAVAYLAAKPGKAARFAYSDLMGLALTREITGTLGVRISEIGAGVDALFRALAEARPAHLEGSWALVERRTARLVRESDLTFRQLGAATIVTSCDPVLVAIATRMMPVSPAAYQSALPFLPQIVRKRR